MNTASILFLSVSLGAVSWQQEAEPQRRGRILRAEQSSDGFVLFAPLRSRVMRLIDREGDVVHEWPEAHSHGVLLENGNLLASGSAPDKNPRFHGPGVGGGVIKELDWDCNVLWAHVVSDAHQQLHHDFDVMPNGNLLYVVREYVSREDAIARGRDPERVDEEGMWPDAIYEIRPPKDGGQAEVVWEWHAWDHLVQDFDETKARFGAIGENPGRIDVNVDHREREAMTEDELAELRELEEQMAALGYGGLDEGDSAREDEYPLGTAPDWLHVNAVTFQPEHDLVVVSVANLSELWVLDHSTTTAEAASSHGGRWGQGGGILWRWGNPRNYGAGEEDDQQLFFQHDPTWISGERAGELRLLVFNNGGEPGERNFSTVDELVLPLDPAKGFRREAGKPFGPVAPAWTFRLPEDCTSDFISGVRRLANGNTLICAGAPGRLLEVTRAGAVVWDYENPHPADHPSEDPGGPPTYAVYRAMPIPRDHPGLAGRDL